MKEATQNTCLLLARRCVVNLYLWHVAGDTTATSPETLEDA